MPGVGDWIGLVIVSTIVVLFVASDFLFSARNAGPFYNRLVRIIEFSHADEKSEYWIGRDGGVAIYYVAVPSGKPTEPGQIVCVKALMTGVKTVRHVPLAADRRRPATTQLPGKCVGQLEPPSLDSLR